MKNNSYFGVKTYTEEEINKAFQAYKSQAYYTHLALYAGRNRPHIINQYGKLLSAYADLLLMDYTLAQTVKQDMTEYARRVGLELHHEVATKPAQTVTEYEFEKPEERDPLWLQDERESRFTNRDDYGKHYRD